MPLGQDLRTARLNRRLTLSQVAERTRVKLKLLEAIENEDFGAMPAPIYAKGFIRLYAECVGLDPHQLIDEYVTRFNQSSGAARLEKDLFTIDRGGIVTRKGDPIAGDSGDESAPAAAVAAVAPPPQPAPTVTTEPTTPAATAPAAVVTEVDATLTEPVAAKMESAELPTSASRLVQPDLFAEPASAAAAPIARSEPVQHVQPVPAPTPLETKVELVVSRIAEHVATPITPPPAAAHAHPAPGHEAHRRMDEHSHRPSDTHIESHLAPLGRDTRRDVPVFPVKAFVITVVTAIVILLCAWAVSRLMQSTPPLPPPPGAAPLRLALDPPPPYLK